MAALIKNRQIVPDTWLLLSPHDDGLLPGIPDAGDVIVPFAAWPACRAGLVSRGGRLGIQLEPQHEPEAIATDLPHFALIAINFPKFSDGRGFSIAQLLRTRYGFQGEIRAVGDVLRDHLQSMERCGFDAFALRADQNPLEALRSFTDFTEAYQSSVTQPLPLFRRRLASGVNAES